MYKVFINDKVICFTNTIEKCDNFLNGLVINFYLPSITPFIVDLLFKGSKTAMVVIQVDDYETAFEAFKKHFQIIKAAGGVVSNSIDELLFIYRLDKWDLPKGKIEKNESVEEAAIREVKEETGINQLELTTKLNDSYHMYKIDDQIVLKQTYWFSMNTNFDGVLQPQIEEGISEAEWVEKTKIADKVLTNTYASIAELLLTNGY